MFSPKVDITNSFNYYQYCMVWPQIAEKMQIQLWCGFEGIACGDVFSNKSKKISNDQELIQSDPGSVESTSLLHHSIYL